MRVSVVDERAHRAADELDRPICVAPRGRNDPEHMQGVRMVRRPLKDATVKLRGPIDAPSAVMGERLGEIVGEASPPVSNLRGQLSGAPVSASSKAVCWFTAAVCGPLFAASDEKVCTRRR
jgi:hypothetical protein